MKKILCMVLAAAMILTAAGCAKKADFPFTDLKLGTDKEAVESQLGSEYIEAGTVPDRMIYYNIRLFDFIGDKEQTKLVINLNSENKAYAYSFYMYDSPDSNYSKVKSYLEGLYGPASEGENASETWTDGDRTFYLFKQSDYVAVGIS